MRIFLLAVLGHSGLGSFDGEEFLYSNEELSIEYDDWDAETVDLVGLLEDAELDDPDISTGPEPVATTPEPSDFETIQDIEAMEKEFQKKMREDGKSSKKRKATTGFSLPYETRRAILELFEKYSDEPEESRLELRRLNNKTRTWRF
jgi:hypothetical protein